MLSIVLRLFVALPLLAAAGCAFAQGAAAGLIRQAEAEQLASHPYWVALLHYRSTILGGVKSEIVSPEFFLSPLGATDPQAELRATLEALAAPPGDAPDQHARCRFVARYKWLRQSLDWRGVEVPETPCPLYQAYTHRNQIESLSLVYATGYLSNPASFYGHILLKFNTRRSALPSELLDQSLNFGADVPRNENAVLYVVKGLFGGYEASFTHAQFYTFNHAYAENELRDLWEYELALTAGEIEQIVDHSWELLGKKYTYFFLKENCAYRMAQLLELVVGGPLLPALPWSMPAVVFDRLAALERKGAPVVRAVRRLPSRQSRFRERYATLSEEQRSAALAIARGADLQDQRYAGLDEGARIPVVDTLLDYYEYRAIAEPDSAEPKAARRSLLRERAALPPRRLSDEGETRAGPAAAPPHRGPLPFMLGVGALHNSALGDGMVVRVRPAAYDELSVDAARIPHSRLGMLDIQVVHVADRWRLRRLDIVDVQNLNLTETPLPGDGGAAWSLRAGLESHDLQCTGCTVARIEGGWGKALSLGEGLAASAILEGRAQNRHAGSGTLAATPKAGLIFAPLPAWKSFVSAGWRKFLNGERSGEPVVRWENRLGSSRTWDVRLSYERHVAHETHASVSFYW